MRTRIHLACICLLVQGLCTGLCSGSNFQLSSVPETVYKNNDFTKRNTESCFFRIIVNGSAPGKGEVVPVKSRSYLFSGDTLFEVREFSREALGRMKRMSYTVTEKTQPYETVNVNSRPQLFDVGFEFAEMPVAWNINKVKIEMTLFAEMKEVTVSLDVPVNIYEQRTELIFPFKGQGIITQGQINNGGHSGHSNQFAIDAIALTPMYAPMANETDSNSAYASWGKEIIAPADGKVLYMRNDVTDNPPGVDPYDVFTRLHHPLHANLGNAVLIDHGNNEYSLLCHMQQGSVSVAEGQMIKRGDKLGKMGSSGDSFQPHIHYQLQNGPVLFRDVSVPVKFINVDGPLVRGNYFHAR